MIAQDLISSWVGNTDPCGDVYPGNLARREAGITACHPDNTCHHSDRKSDLAGGIFLPCSPKDVFHFGCPDPAPDDGQHGFPISITKNVKDDGSIITSILRLYLREH